MYSITVGNFETAVSEVFPSVAEGISSFYPMNKFRVIILNICNFVSRGGGVLLLEIL